MAIRKKFEFAKKCFKISLRCLSSGTENGVLKSVYPDVNIPNVSLPEYVFRNFYKFPHKIAVECSVTGRSYSYEDILFKTRSLSWALRNKLKLLPGDVVAILLPNVPEYPICVFGSLQANLVVTTLNTNFTADEISKQLLDTDAKVVVTLPELHPGVKAALNVIEKKIPIILVRTKEAESLPRDSVCLRELLNSENNGSINIPPAKSDDVAVIPYSSGTTGLPKGVLLTHANLVSNIVQSTHPCFRLSRDPTDNHHDVVPAFLPFSHIFGFTELQCKSLSEICKIVTIPKFSSKSFLQTLLYYQPQTLFVVPSMIHLIINDSSFQKRHFRPVRNFFCAGAPLNVQDEENLINKIGADKEIRQGYGLTETSPAVILCSSRTIGLGIRGSVGELIPNTSVKLIDNKFPFNTIRAPGVPGELLVKGPQMMKGYYRYANEEVFQDGYFKTGDLMYYDERNVFHIVGRLKELIKVNGFQVAPAELEGVLRGHPDVLEVAVIGVPHSRYGEVPRAYIVPKPNRVVRTNTIQEFLASKVTKYKHLLGGVCVIHQIPKNSSGKILKKHLKSLYDSEVQR